MNTNKHKYLEKKESKKVKSKKVRRSEALRHANLLTFLTSCFPRPSHRLITFAFICGYLFSNSYFLKWTSNKANPLWVFRPERNTAYMDSVLRISVNTRASILWDQTILLHRVLLMTVGFLWAQTVLLNLFLLLTVRILWVRTVSVVRMVHEPRIVDETKNLIWE